MHMKQPQMTEKQLAKVQAELKSLKAENARLRQQSKNKQHVPVSRRVKQFFAILLVLLSILLLMLGNIFFWAGNTIAKTDRYVDTVSPIIEYPEVQTALAHSLTDTIFNNVDVEAAVTEALPPRADFLAPQLTSQLRSQTESVTKKIIASDQFKQVWQEVNQRQHERLVNVAKSNQGDGNINLNEVYQQASARLQDTKLAFLANRQLPKDAGEITVIEAPWIPKFKTLVTNIDTWRILSLILLVLSVAGAMALSKNRRRTLYVFTAGSIFAMLATLISIRVGKLIAVDRVRPEYQDAANVVYQQVISQLRLQSILITLFMTALLVVLWLSSASRSAVAVKTNARGFINGTVNERIFGEKKYPALLFIGRHKVTLEWITFLVFTLLLLFVRLSVAGLVWWLIMLVVVIGLIEILSQGSENT